MSRFIDTNVTKLSGGYSLPRQGGTASEEVKGTLLSVYDNTGAPVFPANDTFVNIYKKTGVDGLWVGSSGGTEVHLGSPNFPLLSVYDNTGAPVFPTDDTFVNIYKKTGVDGLWAGSSGGTEVPLGGPDVPSGLNIFVVNRNVPAVNDNYHTVQEAVDAAIAVFESDNLIRENTVVTATLNTVTLDVGASPSNNTYNGMRVLISAGLGAGQRRYINSYVGATNVATLAGNWTIIPDNTSTFQIINTLDTVKPIVHITQGDYTEEQVNSSSTGYLDLYSSVILRAGGYNTANNSESYSVKLNCQVIVNSSSTLEHLVIYRSDNLPRIQLGAYEDWSDFERGFTMYDCSVEFSNATTPAAIAFNVDHSAPVSRNKRLTMVRTRLRSSNSSSDTAVGLLVSFLNSVLIENMFGSNGRMNIDSITTNAVQIFDCFLGGRLVLGGTSVTPVETALLRNVMIVPGNGATNPTIQVVQDGQYIKLENVRVAALAGQSAAIGFNSGVNCTLEHGGLSFDRTSTYGRVNINLGTTPAQVLRTDLPVQKIQTLVGSGAVNLNTTDCYMNLSGGSAVTLANGLYNGQEILLLALSSGGADVLTPANLQTFTTITFNAAGQTALLRWSTSLGKWIILSLVGAVAV